MSKKICKAYCGITCINGYCPNALDDADRNRDDDAYMSYHLDKKISCKDCAYNNGCKDCYFFGREECTHEID